MPLLPLIFQFNAVKAAGFPVQRRQICQFSGSTPLTSLLFRFNAVNAAIFQFNNVNAAVFPVQRLYCR